MNREDIWRMAIEAGYAYSWSEAANEALERFAALVAAAEREACAKVCDLETALWEENSDGQVSLRSVAAVIRARGQA